MNDEEKMDTEWPDGVELTEGSIAAVLLALDSRVKAETAAQRMAVNAETKEWLEGL